MKTFAYVVVSFAAFAPMHAYAGQAQVPSAPFQLADDSNNTCGNGILNILNCNDVYVGVVIGQAQVPNASSQLAWAGDDNDNVCGNGIANIGNCNDIGVGVTIL
jgi:hypothetical protein